MLKRINDFLSGVPMTIVGGACLALSLALRLLGIAVPIDPAWVSILACGIPLLYLSVWRIVHNKGMKKISSALLISVAMFAAIAIGDQFAAGEVAFIMAIGAILEDKTAERAQKGLQNLIRLAPQKGRRIVDGAEQMVHVQFIRVGDMVRVLPGETIPVDGKICAGSTSIDQAVMTGESLPVDKTVGDAVYSGTINRFGAIDLVATKVGEDSALQTLIRMVADAEHNKAPLERIADTWATWLVPVALLIAIVAGILTRDIVRAVTVLVVFCPCALVLATPTAVMAAIGQATKHGVIIKSGDALERMGRVDTIAFDKTGTLTTGVLQVSDVYLVAANITQEALLRVTASVEAYSAHPLAQAITAYTQAHGVAVAAVQEFLMLPGRGVQAQLDGAQVFCGNAAFLRDNGVVISSDVEAMLEALRAQGKAVILTAQGTQLLGAVALSDTLRAGAKDTIAALRRAHTRVVLLTGDHAQTAQYFAAQAGIDEVHADLLPAQKVKLLAQMQAKGSTVCMIGDGVNDAPALKTAHVGVAMGTMGSDIAVDAADIALMGDDIAKIPYLQRLSSAAVRTIKGSIALSLCINLVAILLSILGLLTPTTGALVHNAGSIFVVLLAALLYDRNFIDA